MTKGRAAGRIAASALVLILAGSIVATAPASAAPREPARTGSAGRLGPLTDLVIRRLLVSDAVAASKFGTEQPIYAPAREQQELQGVRQRAESLGIDPDATAAFFQQQIDASKVVQYGLFERWTAHPDEQPATRPGLDQLRDQLDQLTTGLLQQLVDQQDLLSAGAVCRANLAVSTSTGELAGRLDVLHREALDVANASTCH